MQRSAQGNLVQALSALFQRRHPYTQEESFLRVRRKWIAIRANTSLAIYIAVQVSKTVTTMCLHFDEDEREDDGSRFLGIKRVLRRKFRIKELEILMLRSRFLKAVQRRGLDVARIEMELHTQGHSGGIPVNSELTNYVFYPLHLERVRISQRTLMEFISPFLEKD